MGERKLYFLVKDVYIQIDIELFSCNIWTKPNNRKSNNFLIINNGKWSVTNRDMISKIDHFTYFINYPTIKSIQSVGLTLKWERIFTYLFNGLDIVHLFIKVMGLMLKNVIYDF